MKQFFQKGILDMFIRKRKKIAVVYSNMKRHDIAKQLQDLNHVFAINWFDYPTDTEFMRTLDSADILVLNIELKANKDGTKTIHSRHKKITELLTSNKKIITVRSNDEMFEVIKKYTKSPAPSVISIVE